MKEYKLELWARTIIYGFIIACVAGAILIIYLAAVSQSKDAFPIACIVVPAVLLLAALVAYLISRWKLIVTDDSIVFGGFIKDKQLFFSQILGFRLIEKYIIVGVAPLAL